MSSLEGSLTPGLFTKSADLSTQSKVKTKVTQPPRDSDSYSLKYVLVFKE